MKKLLIVLSGFVVLGLPYWITGEKRRFWQIFPILYLVFALGILLHGAVVGPKDYQSPEGFFNPLAYLTFFVQLFFGLPAWISWAISSFSSEIVYLGQTVNLTFHPRFDLGSYYLIVAGGLNYFTVIKLYDKWPKESAVR